MVLLEQFFVHGHVDVRTGLGRTDNFSKFRRQKVLKVTANGTVIFYLLSNFDDILSFAGGLTVGTVDYFVYCKNYRV